MATRGVSIQTPTACETLSTGSFWNAVAAHSCVSSFPSSRPMAPSGSGFAAVPGSRSSLRRPGSKRLLSRSRDESTSCTSCPACRDTSAGRMPRFSRLSTRRCQRAAGFLGGATRYIPGGRACRCPALPGPDVALERHHQRGPAGGNCTRTDDMAIVYGTPERLPADGRTVVLTGVRFKAFPKARYATDIWDYGRDFRLKAMRAGCQEDQPSGGQEDLACVEALKLCT